MKIYTNKKKTHPQQNEKQKEKQAKNPSQPLEQQYSHLPISKDEKYLNLGEHLEELRIRLLIIIALLFSSTTILLIFSPQLHLFLLAPFQNISEQQLILNNVYGGLEVLFKMSFMVAVVGSFPIMMHVLWGFFTPAVQKNIARLGHLVLFSSSLLFWMGIVLAWVFMFPMSLQFLFVDSLPKGVAAVTSVEKYYSFLFLIHLASGVACQLPLFFIGTGAIGIFGLRWHAKYWKVIIILLLVFSAFITPPDPLSLGILATILLLLYAISVFIVFLIERGQRRKD